MYDIILISLSYFIICFLVAMYKRYRLFNPKTLGDNFTFVIELNYIDGDRVAFCEDYSLWMLKDNDWQPVIRFDANVSQYDTEKENNNNEQ